MRKTELEQNVYETLTSHSFLKQPLEHVRQAIKPHEAEFKPELALRRAGDERLEPGIAPRPWGGSGNVLVRPS